MQQRQALDRPDVHARAGDVGELRCDHQVDAGALELPGQPAQLTGLGAGRAADRDGVRADLADQGQHVAAGVDRDRGLDAPGGGVAVGDVDRDRDQAGGRAAGDRGVDLERLGQRADQHHPVRAVAGASTGQVQHLPGEVAEEQDEHQRADREQGDGARDSWVLVAKARTATRPPRPSRRAADDPLELLAAEAQVAAVVAAVAPEHDQPAERQHEVGHGVELRCITSASWKPAVAFSNR